MAAGLGSKTFTTGEVLSAGDVNGYLMQGVLVFASAAARTSAIASPQEGQYSYLKDTNATEYYDGAAWVSASGASGSQTSIASGSLTGSSVTLSSISSAYRDLKLVVFNYRPTTTDLKLMMRFNGASTGYKSNAGTYTANTTFADTEMFISTTADGGAASQALIVAEIPEYANTTAWKYMTYESLVNNETTNTNGAWERDSGLYKSTSAISSITLLPQAGGTFSSGTYVLYGVK
jgi:hypothetical protein